MWTIGEEPFEIKVGTTQSTTALGCSHDYVYRIEREDPRMEGLGFIDLESVHFVDPINPWRARPETRVHGEHVQLGGRAWRTLWERRAEIPDIWWRLTWMEGLNFSQFYLDGMEIFSPHGRYCWAYLRRYRDQVYWGFTPTEYDWDGHCIPAIAMKPSRALWKPTR